MKTRNESYAHLTPSAGLIFDQDYLDKLIEVHKSDAQANANIRMANATAKALEAFARFQGKKRKAPGQTPKGASGAALAGSPLDAHPASTSTASAPSFPGSKRGKAGRARGGRGRAGVHNKGEPKKPGNPKKGFQD